MDESKKYELNKEDGIKILKGMGIAVAGSLLAFATELLPMINFGEYDKVAMILGMMIINAGRKLLKGE